LRKIALKMHREREFLPVDLAAVNRRFSGAAYLDHLLRVITGGADKTAVVFDKETEQVISTLKGHTKKVTHVIYHPTEVRQGCFGTFVFLYARAPAGNLCRIMLRIVAVLLAGVLQKATTVTKGSFKSSVWFQFSGAETQARFLVRSVSSYSRKMYFFLVSVAYGGNFVIGRKLQEVLHFHM